MKTAPLSALLGSVARGPFALLKQFRPERPIHTEGVGLEGMLVRTGGGTSGVEWIDAAGSDPVRARFSRSIGLPQEWPDILGLALRCPMPPTAGGREDQEPPAAGGRVDQKLPPAGGPADQKPPLAGGWQDQEPPPAGGFADKALPPVGGSADQDPRADILLATAGSGRLSRYVPTVHRHVPDEAFASFMPYRGANGPVLVAAHPEPRADRLPARLDRFRASVAAEAWVLGLYWASPVGPWHRFGTVELRPGAPVDAAERFDPLLNVPPGAGNYAWTHRLREPSYVLARTPRQGPPPA